MNALPVAINALFADDNIGKDALYTSDDGSPITVRIVARRADEITGFGDGQIWSETTRIDLRVAEIANPRPGDRIEILGSEQAHGSGSGQPGEVFIIQGEPVRDPERLIWTIALRPA